MVTFSNEIDQSVELIEALKLMKEKFPNSMDYSAQLAFEYLKKQRLFSKAAIAELTYIGKGRYELDIT